MNSGQTTTKLIFFGNERLVSGLKSTDTPILRGLIDAGYEIAAIVAHHTDSRSRSGRPLEVAAVAAEYDIPLLTPDRPADIADRLASYQADAAILVAYGRIISQSIIDLFPKGIINIHPSLLPAYRGSTPIESPILNGDYQTGVSIMQLAAKMDAGPVYAQEAFSILPTDTKFDVYENAARVGTNLLLASLPQILDGSLAPTEQDESLATYCQQLSKSDGILDPSTQTAVDAERRVRAFLEYPKSRIDLASQPIIVTKAHVSSEALSPLDIQFSDGAYLSIDTLKPAGKKEMPARAFLAGYGARLQS